MAESEVAAQVAGEVVVSDRVNTSAHPVVGSGDFVFMVQAKPDRYIWLGNGVVGGYAVYNPSHDFNDEISVIGARYWAKLVEPTLLCGA